LNSDEIISNSPEETQAIAKSLVESSPDLCAVALHGELGAGKTCFVQGIAAALDINEPITSPTFTIINEYDGTRKLQHMDLYRLSSSDEVLALGFEDYLSGNGIIAIEWPDRAEELLPAETVHVYLKAMDQPDCRSITIRSKK
jgi:tRNA threonylcarbamoyladenosine biosynthesis protein TsaE